MPRRARELAGRRIENTVTNAATPSSEITQGMTE
jgi:hypothetical protein